MAKKDIEIERMKEYVSDARKEKIQNRKLKEELRIYKMTADEFADVFVKVGELVENTNLPRIGEQLVIEFRKLKEEIAELKRVNKIIRAGAKTELMEYGMEKGRMIDEHKLEIEKYYKVVSDAVDKIAEKDKEIEELSAQIDFLNEYHEEDKACS